jgi:hypothetical protein
LDNLALACFFCNRYKGPNLSGFDPATGALTQLFDPRSQIWADHFFGQAANCREKLRMAEQQLPFFGSMISLG